MRQNNFLYVSKMKSKKVSNILSNLFHSPLESVQRVDEDRQVPLQEVDVLLVEVRFLKILIKCKTCYMQSVSKLIKILLIEN